MDRIAASFPVLVPLSPPAPFKDVDGDDIFCETSKDPMPQPGLSVESWSFSFSPPLVSASQKQSESSGIQQ